MKIDMYIAAELGIGDKYNLLDKLEKTVVDWGIPFTSYSNGLVLQHSNDREKLVKHLCNKYQGVQYDISNTRG